MSQVQVLLFPPDKALLHYCKGVFFRLRRVRLSIGSDIFTARSANRELFCILTHQKSPIVLTDKELLGIIISIKVPYRRQTMVSQFDRIQELVRKKADLHARLNLMPYDGAPEIKQNGTFKYLYVRKRIAGRLTSTYVGVYSEELYNLLLRNAKEAREIRRELRSIEKQLAALGYSEDELPANVLNNIAFARANMKVNIYDQAVLEGVATSFPQTEEIIENGKVSGMTSTDIQKVLNLKHAWEFILDRDVIASKSDYYMLSHIARLVNEGFFLEGGRIRGVPVSIGGSSYVPPLPIEADVIENIRNIVESKKDAVDIAIELCLYCMKAQIFLDGNKRASVIFANQYLIAHGGGFLVIPESDVPEFKNLLVKYYEGEEFTVISAFLKKKCWKPLKNQ